VKSVAAEKSVMDRYLEKLTLLDELIRCHKGDSEEADALRDEMDPLWFQMSEQDRVQLSKDGAIHIGDLEIG
jgi:hypothetical protein